MMILEQNLAKGKLYRDIRVNSRAKLKLINDLVDMTVIRVPDDLKLY